MSDDSYTKRATHDQTPWRIDPERFLSFSRIVFWLSLMVGIGFSAVVAFWFDLNEGTALLALFGGFVAGAFLYPWLHRLAAQFYTRNGRNERG